MGSPHDSKVDFDAEKAPEDPSFGTKAIHAGQDPDQWKCKAVIPLISLSTTFKQTTPGVLDGVNFIMLFILL